MTEKKTPEVIEDKDLDEASGGVAARLSGLRSATATATKEETDAAQSANNLKQLGLGVASGDGSV